MSDLQNTTDGDLIAKSTTLGTCSLTTFLLCYCDYNERLSESIEWLKGFTTRLLLKIDDLYNEQKLNDEQLEILCLARG